MRASLSISIALLVVAVVAPGCAGGKADKAGGRLARETTPANGTVHAVGTSRPSSSSGEIPDGAYVSTMTREDVRRGGVPAGDQLYKFTPMRHRLVLRSGAFWLYDRFPDGHTEVGFSGTYSLYRNRVVFVGGPDRLSFVWSFDGKRLRFGDFPRPGYFTATFLPVWTKTD